MIRPLTCICMLLAAGSGLYLYQTKHHALMLDRKIDRILNQVDAARQRVGMLRAEYALLNDPSRLAELAAQLLPALQTTAPGQFTTMTDLDRRLPPVGPAPDAAPPPPAADPLVAAAAPAAPPVVVALTALPAAGPVATKPDLRKIDAARAMPYRVLPPTLAVAPRHPAPRAPTQLAQRPGRPMPRLAPTRPPVRYAERPAQLMPVAAFAPRPMVGSALGMARTMLPTTQPASYALPAGNR